MRYLILAALMSVALGAKAAPEAEVAVVGQVFDFNHDIDVSQYKNLLSVQAQYSPTTIPAAAVVVTSNVILTDDYIYKIANGAFLGMAVLYTPGSGKTITGLTAETTYYAIPRDANTFKLAASTTLAAAGTAIDLTAVTASGSYTFKPLALITRSQIGFQWQASNDGTNYQDLTTATFSSVTYSAAGGTLWTLTPYAYHYLRLRFLGPSAGGIDLTATLHGVR